MKHDVRDRTLSWCCASSLITSCCCLPLLFAAVGWLVGWLVVIFVRNPARIASTISTIGESNVRSIRVTPGFILGASPDCSDDYDNQAKWDGVDVQGILSAADGCVDPDFELKALDYDAVRAS